MLRIDIQEFKSGFHGKVFEPGDPGYDDACRIWNASVNKHPRLIARCSGVADVAAAVNFARANQLLAAIRGGGHNVGGRALCDDGIVIDLSGMRSVYVDCAKRTVRVGGGATLGDKLVGASEVHGGCDVSQARASGDKARMLINADVPDPAGVVIPGIPGLENRSVKC